jgi:hypothetical protein
MLRSGYRTTSVGRIAVMVIGGAICLSGALRAADVWETPPVEREGGAVILRTVLVEDEDDQPMAAGAKAARQLLAAIGDAPLQAVLVSECFEDLELKKELLRGICSVIPKERVFGSSTYGSFTQQGTAGFDSVCLLGIAGDGISVAAALVTDMDVARLTFEEDEPLIKQRLNTAGKRSPKNCAGQTATACWSCWPMPIRRRTGTWSRAFNRGSARNFRSPGAVPTRTRGRPSFISRAQLIPTAPWR